MAMSYHNTLLHHGNVIPPHIAISWQCHTITHGYIMAMSYHNTLLHHGNVIPKQGLIHPVIQDCTYLILGEDMQSVKVLWAVA